MDRTTVDHRVRVTTGVARDVLVWGVMLAMPSLACTNAVDGDYVGANTLATGPADAESDADAGSDADAPDEGSSSGDGPDDGSGGTSPDACPQALQMCDGQCWDTQSDPQRCGDCDALCLTPNAAPACVAGQCEVEGCDPGWYDCDGAPTNGCEIPDECIEGESCTTTCGSIGRLDCGGTGCDANSCEAPIESCNAADDDCDGACDESLPGCRVAVHRALGPTGHLYTTDIAEAQSGGFSLEHASYFSIYGASVGNLEPLYRCLKPDGTRFMTRHATCEVLGIAPELTVGWVAAEPTCGSMPLFRLYRADGNFHFYTVSEAERDNAVTTYGYVTEGVAAHVWPG